VRVLFDTLPAKAHLFAQIPVAWALRAAGHEVCIASSPELSADITASGLTAVALGPELNQSAMAEHNREREAEAGTGAPSPEDLLRLDEFRPEELTYDFMHGLFTVMTTLVFKTFSPRDMMDDLVRFARGWEPDLVVWDTMVLGGGVAAEACGAAHARLLYGLDLVGKMRESYLSALRRRPPGLCEDPLREWLEPVLARYGCGFSEDVVVGQWTIDPVPSSLRLDGGQLCVPVRGVPYNGRAVVPGWLREPPKRRRVCLTLGLSHREVLGGDRVSVAGLLDALGGLDVEVVATLNADQLSGVREVPGNVRVVDFVPLNELLPTCSAVVHQGGFGQSQSAIVHGVPQVVVPNGLWDTVPRALRLQELGVGLCGGEIAEMVRRVLDEPSFTRAARRLRTEVLATPAPSDIVPLLEKLAAASR
jgi:glycosyltransferase (activator-dependent family)